MNHDKVTSEVKQFKEGFPYTKIIRPAMLHDGIVKLSDSQLKHFAEHYENSIKNYSVIKFVPASGAATRMFAELFELANQEPATEALSPYLTKFFSNIRKFAFAQDLEKAIEKGGSSIDTLLAQKKYQSIAKELIEVKGLNYGQLPKGLLLFHSYNDENRTSAHEQIVEGISYAKSKGGVVGVHFTVSPEHMELFKMHTSTIASRYPNSQLKISFSQQKKETDTIAVDINNDPYKDEDGGWLFRPAGHGALLENLNDIEADILFIKNIDNVAPDRLKDQTVIYKKVMAGFLLEVQQKSHYYLRKLSETVSIDFVEEVEAFVKYNLNVVMPKEHLEMTIAKRASFLVTMLNRPIRVCGMVKNTGEPGGGPYWVQKDGKISLQIVESNQLDHNDPFTRDCMMKATHFNPVDIVCGVRDYNGEKFNLLNYRDDNAGLIIEKTYKGEKIRALELPGLWNGGMAFWNSIFIEVPLSTFNPVKTVNDLLRDEHQ